MSNRQPFHALVCKHCQRAIPLPPAMHPDISVGLGSWPTDGLKRSFLCDQCKRVYEYSAGDVQLLPAGKDPRRENISYDVMTMWLQCGEQNCEAPLRIRTIAASDKDANELAMAALSIALLHAVHCDKGHTSTGKMRPYGVSLVVMYDEDWKSAGMDFR